MGMNKEDEELVKMVNPTLKKRETILFFLNQSASSTLEFYTSI